MRYDGLALHRSLAEHLPLGPRLRVSHSCTKRGPTLSSGAFDSLQAFLATPVSAALLGLTLGVGLLELCRFGASFFTADDPWLGMARTLVVNAVAMGVALAAIALYFVYVRPGLVPFGLSLAGGFMLMACIALFRFAGPVKATSPRR